MNKHLPLTDAKLEELLRGRREIRRLSFRMLDRPIGIKPLSDGEIDMGKLEAQRYCKRIGADVDMDPEFLEREKERQIVWRSVYDPDSGKPLFPSDDDVRALDAAAVRAFFNAYMEVMDTLTPSYTLDDAEVEGLIDELGKGGGVREVLRHFEHATLRACVRSLASRLREKI